MKTLFSIHRKEILNVLSNCLAEHMDDNKSILDFKNSYRTCEKEITTENLELTVQIQVFLYKDKEGGFKSIGHSLDLNVYMKDGTPIDVPSRVLQKMKINLNF